MEDEIRAIVIDNGSDTIKAGFAGDDEPRAVFPSIVGWDDSSSYVGEKALSQPGVVASRRPIERGLITDWDAMTEIWEHCYYSELRAASEEHPLLLTESPLNPPDSREKMAQIAFEKLQAPACYLAIQAVLSLFAAGSNTGVALDSGDGTTHVVPIHEGFTIREGIVSLDFAGADLTDYLARALAHHGYDFSPDEQSIARDIKERLCDVALDIDHATQAVSQSANGSGSYKLPDGQVIDVGNERFLTPEGLFRPSIMGIESCGIHEAISKSITMCDVDIRRQLWQNVVLSGGNTLYPGLRHRVERELGVLAPSNIEVKVVARPERKYDAWIGGSILTSLSPFQNLWVSKVEYEESGPSVVRRKCF